MIKHLTRIGLFSVGYDKYWNQFPGLKEELLEKDEVFRNKLPIQEFEVINFGMVDSPYVAYEKVRDIVQSDIDILFCNMLTYATSGTFGVICRLVNCPIVLVALQPNKALDYQHATTYMQLVNDNICALPEFSGVAVRMGKHVPDVIVGSLYDDNDVNIEIMEYCSIAKVLHSLRYARLAHIGHPLNSMMDMNTDPTMISSFFGPHIFEYEPNDLLSFVSSATNSEIDMKKKSILSFFDTPDPVSDPISMKLTDKDLTTSALVSIALDKFVNTYDLDGIAYYYNGKEGSKIQELMANLIVGNSLLNMEHIPMCGESDLKTLIALMIMDRLGMGGSFAEFHPIDFNGGFALVGHDGPHNISIAEGKPVLRSLKKYHGKPGCGAGVEFKIKEGPITLLSINSTYDGKFKFIIAEGESVHGLIPATGNTNTRGYFKPDIKTFLKNWIKEGPTHHFALGVGHHAEVLAKIARYLNLDYQIVSMD